METFKAKEEIGGDKKWSEHNVNIPIKIIQRKSMVLLGAYVQAQGVL